MKAAIFQRLFLGFVLVIAVIVLNFLLLQAAPGDVVDAMLAEAVGGDPELAAKLRASYGLDQPIHVQLFKYLARVMSGDLGYSFYYDETVSELILSHLPTTLHLPMTLRPRMPLWPSSRSSSVSSTAKASTPPARTRRR